eukprot:26157-Amphidinium_carterae.1
MFERENPLSFAPDDKGLNQSGLRPKVCNLMPGQAIASQHSVLWRGADDRAANLAGKVNAINPGLTTQSPAPSSRHASTVVNACRCESGGLPTMSIAITIDNQLVQPTQSHRSTPALRRVPVTVGLRQALLAHHILCSVLQRYSPIVYISGMSLKIVMSLRTCQSGSTFEAYTLCKPMPG